MLAQLLGWTSARGQVPFDPVSLFLFVSWRLVNGWSRAQALRNLCHPRYADRVTDMDAVGFYRVFRKEGPLPAALVTYLQSWTHIVSYVPVRDTALTANLQRTCAGEVVIWSPHPDGTRHITEHPIMPISAL